MNFVPTNKGDVGNMSVKYLNQGNMPQALQQQIAIAKARLQADLNHPDDAVTAGSSMTPTNESMGGLTPFALQALKAIMAKNQGASHNPGADTRLRQGVDLAYPQ